MDGKVPKFAQLYIHDMDFEDSNRVSAHGIGASKNIDESIVNDLRQMIDEHNPYAKIFRRVEERLKQGKNEEVMIRLIGNRANDGRTYNMPTTNEVAALIVGDVDSAPDKRDIVIQYRSGHLKRINELSPFYLPLQYPLLFNSGEDGWRPGIPHSDKESDDVAPGTVSLREFTAYRIQDRDFEGPQIMLSRKLLQQYLVDSYCMIESQRLNWVKRNQKKLRIESRKKVQQSIANGETEGSSVGKRVVLPTSFTGGARFMKQNFQDAMAICRWAGYPSLFITFTCNPKWPEITKLVNRKGVRPEDRPDILARVFKIKLDELINDLKGGSIFGETKAVIYTVEFQKRGLPHVHIVLFLVRGDNINTPAHIDNVISAEIPDKETDPSLYAAVKEYMLHGPCGRHNERSPCMANGKCTKKFPKKFNTQTTVDDNGYPVYRRRDQGMTVDKNGVLLDNRYVVPYNRTLLLKYKAHINVEYCNQSRAIKYLFKYINKGYDRISAEIDKENEVKQYLDCRYVSSCEAAWRIYGFEIHYQSVPVERLQFHLDGDESCMYYDESHLSDVVEDPSVAQLKFIKWMEMNKNNAKARRLKYWEFPQYFVWDSGLREWRERKQRFAIGRLNYVPVGSGEIYYLRVMLNHIRGPTCYEDLRTVDGFVHPTYKDACFALGLLDDDKEYIDAITCASQWASAAYLRHLFTTLLMSNSMSRPDEVWEKTWNFLADDVLYNARNAADNPELHITEEQLKNIALSEIEKMLSDNYSSLRNFAPMLVPDTSILLDGQNKMLLDEISYDRVALKNEHDISYKLLNEDQRVVYDRVMSSVDGGRGGVFFVYGSGGTGKTFIWKTLCSALRSRGDIVLPVASSGIASLLMTRGRTAHSRFGIPINIDETSMCSKIKPGSDMAALLKNTKLIIWDEAPMTHKHCFEALDRSLRDIMRTDGESSNKPFGGLVVVFGGAFRQILPVVVKGSRQDIVHAAICSSNFWDSCEVLKLTKNMRLKSGSSDAEAIKTKDFANWILDIGDGNAGGENDGEIDVEIPSSNLIDDVVDPIAAIINDTYPNLVENMGNYQYFQDRAILAPTNEMVENINVEVLSKLSGEEFDFMSADSICQSEGGMDGNEDMFSVEFLNTIRCSGVPNHEIRLKVGCMIMLLRNIDQSKELCNGTRLIVTKLTPYVIEAQIITGSRAGERVLIGRMILSPSDNTKYLVIFQRRQFPVAVCYGMTINKSQGQSLSNVGLYLPTDVFSHGQLYVALSRVTTKKGLRVLIGGENGYTRDRTKNVVYKEVFHNL